ncbi:MAG: hypothetical protein ACK401_06040 [Archaeoglobaceae archaeon]
MNEIDFRKLISNLWASGIFKNKEFVVQKILRDEKIESIRNKFKQLLYGTGEFAKRFDSFEIKGIGPAYITEILCYFNPNEFGIWNRRSRDALKRLGFHSLPLNKYKISGEEYRQVNDTLKQIAQKLGSLGFQTDLLGVDYLLYLVQQQEEFKKEEIPKTATEPITTLEFDHEEIVSLIEEIGILLGFDVETEYLVAPGARLDVVWTVKIANLGYIGYAFEIHKSGSLDSLVLNLLKALSSPGIQKIVAVSDSKQLQKLEEEIQNLPENFRKSLVFWEVNEVIKAHQKLSEALDIISKLGLVTPLSEE